MPLEFQLKVQGAKEIHFAIGGLAAKINDWTEDWPYIVRDLSIMEANQFAREGARGPAGQWAQLSEDYAEHKARISPGALILQTRENRLYQSLVMGGPGYVEEFKPKSMRYGTEIEYALYHQMGTSRGMPARRIFDFKPEDDKQLGRTLNARARIAARKLGFAAASKLGERDATAQRAMQLGRGIIMGEIPSPFPP